MKKRKKILIPEPGIPIPAGTEQETGFTRGETEKINGPVKFTRFSKKTSKIQKNKTSRRSPV